ncbi:pseudouridine synthase [Mycena maculata]|uniref:21S rRNA pseudouridine(2819) synthase n=1 Tax=Mycena maculata TaxID=230809 RepID=A0AAD7ISM1_9AGAR|nr:pseudouridine synthase [Mycena maculata]
MNWRDKLSKSVFRWSERVLYVDRSIIIMNKPPSLVTQLDPTTTKADGGNLAKLLDDLKQALDLPNPPYRVHRLDKVTTGCLVLARSKDVARQLSTQFRIRTVDKTYLALVRGGSECFPKRAGQIRVLLKYPDGRASLALESDLQNPPKPPRESETDWEVVASSVASSPHPPFTLLRLKLLTGLKHQLRVHLAQVLNTPILGDILHSQGPEVKDPFRLPHERVYLHASQISLFRYRRVGGKKQFKIRVFAPLPPDFVQLCTEAGIPIGEYERSGGLFKSESGSEDDYQAVADGEIPDVNGYWIPEHK